MQSVLSPHASDLLALLSALARKGPIEAIGRGDKSVGMTLLNALGIDYTSSGKPSYRGIVVNARRDKVGAVENRMNLFARVPAWDKSNCKSSEEIVRRYGYDSGRGSRKLFCTVRARRPNSQGLFLHVDTQSDQLEERVASGGSVESVATWSLSDLRQRLAKTHPETMWVTAKSSFRDGVEQFHYRGATYASAPLVERLPLLLAEGTVTVDHLIESTNAGTREKGPLFKISPSNFSMLFPEPLVFDLLAM